MYEGAVWYRLNDHTFLCMEIDSFILKNKFSFGPFDIRTVIYTVYFLIVESQKFKCPCKAIKVVMGVRCTWHLNLYGKGLCPTCARP
jgi:hypothetical protein